jgi:cob(I)alamin adenosyltransferase
MKKSSVYTKSGDKGTTGLIGGTRVMKNDIRLDAYGTVDELNSWVGVLRSYIEEDDLKELIVTVQNQLFVIGSYLATDPAASDFRSDIKLKEVRITELENMMDKLEEELPPLKDFILPGGHPATGFCHVARTVCRRAERKVIELSAEHEINDWIIRYINRLSDFLFVLSRHLANYFNAEEIRWNSEL